MSFRISSRNLKGSKAYSEQFIVAAIDFFVDVSNLAYYIADKDNPRRYNDAVVEMRRGRLVHEARRRRESQEGAEAAGRIGQGRIWVCTAEVGCAVACLRRVRGARPTVGSNGRLIII